jgi:hypothetical protein
VNPKEKNPICLCNCNFSIGWILEVQEDTISGAPLYTVMACNSKGTVFAPYKDILASDWTLYDVGQRVAMVPYYTMSYLCCSDKSGGGGPRGCKPVVSEDEKTDESWRTTYRIIPLCTLKIPLKVEKERWNPNG